MKQEFLFIWFEQLHIANRWPKYEFSSETLFDEKYLMTLLAVTIPQEFSILLENKDYKNEGTVRVSKVQ